MLLISCDAEIVREAAPETPHLLDAREEALQDERVAPQNHHVSGIEKKFWCTSKSFMVMPLTRSSGVHATIVHRSAMLRLVRGLEPLDLVHALIDPKGAPSTMANLRKQLPSARYEERKASKHSFLYIHSFCKIRDGT